MNRDAAPGSSARAHFGIGAPVAGVIGLATQGRPRAALALAGRAAASDAEGVHPAGLASGRALARFIAADFDSAAEQGEIALQLCDERASEQSQRQAHGPADSLTRALAVAARLLASAGTPWAGVDLRSDEGLAAELIDAVPPLAGRLSPSERPYVASLIVEALFANGRVSDAERCLALLAPEGDWSSDPLRAPDPGLPLPSFPFLPVRMLFYMGRTAEAEALLRRVLELPEVQQDRLWPRLADAMIALCAAARGETSRVRTTARKVAAAFPRPRTYLEGSARVLAGHGLALIGDLHEAAREMRAGGGPRLRRLIVVDRALAIEVLVREAIQRDDQSTAAEWARALLELEAHPAASETALRVFAQIDLASGAADSALRRSEASLARARLTGSLRDAAETELLRCRTLVALGRRTEAAAELQRVAASARSRGDEGERREAARQLRALGHRVAPERGSGWKGLTEREREVALLAAEGFGNRAIGDAVFLSSRSVAGIVARVMAAFDVTRRAALAAAIHPPGSAAGRSAAAPVALTRRQLEVAGLIARGRTNTEIAAELGISPRTVERHVSTALAASGAGSRTGLARLALVQSAPAGATLPGSA